jgi:uncharacterized protein
MALLVGLLSAMQNAIIDDISRWEASVHAQLQKRYEIRDPIHKAIRFSSSERLIIDSPFVQRMRDIRQLGFSLYPFPGASHSRFIHSLGAMELAGRVFDRIFDDNPFTSENRKYALRSCLRMAALLHDIGHGPFSHAAEFAMPNTHQLGFIEQPNRRASHEDYTVAILLRSSLTDLINAHFPFSAKHVASLIDSKVKVEDDFFVCNGLDFKPILSQCISSNLDVDRLDYLMRDSYFAGVQYGTIDVDWLIHHMSRHEDDNGRIAMALDRTALYAFDHYLVARYHMFLMVYFHKKSVAYEIMLKEYMTSKDCQYQIPSDLEAYLRVDDAHLWQHLQSQSHPSAQSIVQRDPPKTVFERHGLSESINLKVRQLALEAEGIVSYSSRCIGECFSEPKAKDLPIYVMGSTIQGEYENTPLASMSGAFQNKTFEVCISRLYVPKHHIADAQRILKDLENHGQQMSLTD